MVSRAVYKPYRGERELWDFPDGLFPREVAAYRLSEMLGWGIVPETVGQPATMTLDADPTKQLTGKVTSVANVGEQRPGQDAKVFEVKIEIEQTDTTLRPGMTRSGSFKSGLRPRVAAAKVSAVTPSACARDASDCRKTSKASLACA